ncbi:protein zntC-like [Diprion similis]|uniref:protein zntC-like n=1 Tax=Diprion similis TaxID=362088 RepID=UPI001EF80188|nr:protein zntC-like [Diprion similis]
MGFNDWQAKLAGMVVIGGFSFLIGLFLAKWFKRRFGEQRLLFSILLCFGAGVLLATSGLHMLPQTMKSLPNYGALVYFGGFSLLFLVDGIFYFIWGQAVDLPHSNRPATSRRIEPTSRLPFNENCRTNDGYNNCLHTSVGNFPDEYLGHNPDTQASYQSYTEGEVQDAPNDPHLKNSIESSTNVRYSHHGSESNNKIHSSAASASAPRSNEVEPLLSHEAHTELDSNSNASPLGLVMALTLHAIFEGLAIGLQTDVPEVWLLVAAVASHKLVVAFCLGIQLSAGRFLWHVIGISAFAGGSVAGIGGGMAITQISQNWVTEILIPVLNGIAGGSLLYVTVSEVLPGERAKWQNTPIRAARIWLFLSYAFGFVLIFVLSMYTGGNYYSTSLVDARNG